MKSAVVENMRLQTLVAMFLVCLISNDARSDIRIGEHLYDLLNNVFLPSIDESTRHREEAGGRRGDLHNMFLIFPVDGKVSSFFGRRKDPFYGAVTFHEGIDIADHAGSPVLASGRGVVAYAGQLGGCGKTCVLDHGDGLNTRYCHLGELDVSKGEEVAFGQRIGSMGTSGRSTGPHLHFEVRIGGIAVDPARHLAF